MKIIIAGGRDYNPTSDDDINIRKILLDNNATEIISGGASGVDTWGEQLANTLNLPVTRFLPDWSKYGKAAGPLRNSIMARYADAVILLKGGRGTASMKREAILANIKILYELI